MKTRILHTKIYSDDFFIDLSPIEKLLFIYFLTNENMNILHIYECPDRLTMFQTGVSATQLKEAKQKFMDVGKIIFHKSYVYVKNADKYEDYSGDKYDKAKEAIRRQLGEDIMNYFLTSQRPVRDQSETGCQPDIIHKPKTIINNFGKSENLFFGDIPEDLMELAQNLYPRGDARSWQEYAAQEIRQLGYKVSFEVAIELEGDRNGRIDLVAVKDDKSFAIELDYRTPRKKSIEKVKKFGCGMVLLRDPKIINSDKRDVDSSIDTTIDTTHKQETRNKNEEDVKGELKKDDIKEKEILSFILSFNKLFDTNYQVTDKRRLQLSLRRKRFSYLQIEKALTNLSQSSFHRGKNDRGWCADPDFLIRNDEQVDKWLNTPQENKPNDHMSREEYARLMSTGEMKGKIDPDGYLHM